MFSSSSSNSAESFHSISLDAANITSVRAKLEQYLQEPNSYHQTDIARAILSTLHLLLDQRRETADAVLELLSIPYEHSNGLRTFGMKLLSGDNAAVNKEIVSYIHLLHKISRIDAESAEKVLAHLQIVGMQNAFKKKERLLIDTSINKLTLILMAALNQHEEAANALLILLSLLAYQVSAQKIYALLMERDLRCGANFGMVLAMNIAKPALTQFYIVLIDALQRSEHESISMDQVHELMATRDKMINYAKIKVAIGRQTLPEVLVKKQDFASLYLLIASGFLPEELYARDVICARETKQGLIQHIQTLESADVKVQALRDALNPETALGRLILQPRIGGRLPNTAPGSTIAMIQAGLVALGAEQVPLDFAHGNLGRWAAMGRSIHTGVAVAAAAAVTTAVKIAEAVTPEPKF
jgi:hypothetical protein